MRGKIMSKYNNINLYDVSFCLQDDDGNTLEDKNGKPKLFRYKGDIYSPFDYLQSITEDTTLDMLEEIK
jgi:hypothetical protein